MKVIKNNMSLEATPTSGTHVTNKDYVDNKQVTISWEDYQALSYDEQHNGTTYYIPNIPDVEADEFAYHKLIDSNPYSILGNTYGINRGYLRMYNKPYKIAVIGNSMTAHAYKEADGIEWTVSDYREMAASHPNTGWVTLLQQYITSHVNSECKVYKSNGSDWEFVTRGSRSYSDLSSAKAFEVKEDGAHEVDGLTIDTMLTEDTDIVIVQLYESVAIPTTSEEKEIDTKDYVNLYQAIREKCPNARMYQYCGFWLTEAKTQCVIKACQLSKVTPIQGLAILDGFNTRSDSVNPKCVAGDIIYDANDTQISTVSSMVANHPNDVGFQVMATSVINALFNEISFDNNQHKLMFSRNTTTENFKIADFFNIDKTDDITFNDYYKTWCNYFLVPGVYSFTARNTSECHGIFKVDGVPGRYSADATQAGIPVYNPIRQTWESLNSNETLSRTVKLAASDLEWNDFT